MWRQVAARTRSDRKRSLTRQFYFAQINLWKDWRIQLSHSTYFCMWEGPCASLNLLPVVLGINHVRLCFGGILSFSIFHKDTWALTAKQANGLSSNQKTTCSSSGLSNQKKSVIVKFAKLSSVVNELFSSNTNSKQASSESCEQKDRATGS